MSCNTNRPGELSRSSDPLCMSPANLKPWIPWTLIVCICHSLYTICSGLGSKQLKHTYSLTLTQMVAWWMLRMMQAMSIINITTFLQLPHQHCSNNYALQGLCWGELPPNLPGGNSKPLPETGGVYMLEAGKNGAWDGRDEGGKLSNIPNWEDARAASGQLQT